MNYQIKFGELLRKMIEKSNFTIYSLSKQSGLNRTFIQKVLAGERSLSKKQLNQLLPFLHLTPEETIQLEQSRLIEQIGLSTFVRCQYIKDLAENIGIKKTDSISANIINYIPLSNYSFPTVFQHQYQIINLIYAMAKESSYLYLYSSFDSTFIVEMLEILQREEFESIQITHLIPFIKGSLEHNSYMINNVKMLSYILPFAFQNPTDYHANFYYEDFSIGQTNLLFPYYLISDKYVLVFSRDYRNAMLLGDSPHAYYKGAFEKLNSSATSLFQCIDTPLSVLEEYCSLKQTNCAYALDRQPCILHYIDEDMPNNLIYNHVELKQLITDVILARHHQLQEITETITTFTWQGLVDFVKNGIIYDYPQEFSRPFTPEERLLILNRILASNEAGKKLFLLVNEKIFHPCQEFTCFSSGLNAVFTFFSNGTYKVCTTHETTITLALQEFMENAVAMNYIYNAEKSNELIREAIRLIPKQ